jgi:hypothetical protein
MEKGDVVPPRVSKYTRPHTSHRSPKPLWDLITPHLPPSALHHLSTMPPAKVKQISSSRARSRISRTSIDAPRPALSAAANIICSTSSSRMPTRSSSAAAGLAVVKDGAMTQRLVRSEIMHDGHNERTTKPKLTSVRAFSDFTTALTTVQYSKRWIKWEGLVSFCCVTSCFLLSSF